MIRLFALHSPFGLMTATAALENGALGDAARNILVPMNTAVVPETAVDLATAPRFESLRRRFHRVESLNALIDPRHPTRWEPDGGDLPMLERLFRRAWELGDDEVELFVQSPQVAPARTLMALFSTARLGVIGDGLMTYSPIRTRLPRRITERVTRVVYPDIVPGVEPLVFSETGAVRMPMPPAAFGAMLREVGAAEPDAELDRLAGDDTRTALVLGQYLAALGLVSTREERQMQVEMIDRAADAGAQRVVFKPHPSAPPALAAALAGQAERRGMTFAEYAGDQPAEYVAQRLAATDVVAGFSTVLPTVRALFGIRTHAVGTEMMLARLNPYENSNRVPVAIVDAMTRDEYAQPGRMQQLVDTVGYAMQPGIVAHLRPRAVEFLTSSSDAERERCVPADRRRALDLPGAAPVTGLRRAWESAGGVGRVGELRLTAAGVRRRARRVWKAATGR